MVFQKCFSNCIRRGRVLALWRIWTGCESSAALFPALSTSALAEDDVVVSEIVSAVVTGCVVSLEVVSWLGTAAVVAVWGSSGKLKCNLGIGSIKMGARSLRTFSVGCATVQADHAPEAGVAQGIFHGILVRHHGRNQEEVEEGLEDEVERHKEEDTQEQVRMPMTTDGNEDTQTRLEPHVTV